MSNNLAAQATMAEGLDYLLIGTASFAAQRDRLSSRNAHPVWIPSGTRGRRG